MATRNPLALIADVAARYVGIAFETSKNQGPHLAEFWQKTNYQEGIKNREPWCCAFTVFCIQTADAETTDFNLVKPPKMAACSTFMEWARDPKNGCTVFGPDSAMKPRKGDVVCYLPRLSHIGVVAEDYAGDGFIRTIEGNTNAEGAREGDGVYRKQRRLNFAGSFVRLPSERISEDAAGENPLIAEFRRQNGSDFDATSAADREKMAALKAARTA